MKKVINKKVYNTETAEELFSYMYGSINDFNYWSIELYKTKKGIYFSHAKGGPLSKYAIDCGNNERSGGEEWLVLREEEAFNLMSTYSTAEKIENYFPTYLEEA